MIFVVEVGVLTTEGYEVPLHFASGIKTFNLYDEDVSGFDNLQDAKKYADEYVAQGVLGTYAYIWESETVNTYDGELVVYFKHKTDSTYHLINSLQEIKKHMDIICGLQTPEGEALINEMGLNKFPFSRSLDEVASEVQEYLDEVIEKDGVLE